MSATSFEANLHSLVDDEIDERRRTETLAKLALSPTDNEKLVSWRRQNQMIRAAFAGVEAEAIPLSLSLMPTPHVIARPFAAAAAPARFAGRQVAAAMCCGIGGAAVFALALWPTHMQNVVDVTPVATIAAASPSGAASNLLHRVSAPGASRHVTLPDLSRAGLVLSKAEFLEDAPGPVACGTYVAAGRGTIVLCGQTAADKPRPSADQHSWRRGATLYSLADDAGDMTLAARIRAAMDTQQ